MGAGTWQGMMAFPRGGTARLQRNEIAAQSLRMSKMNSDASVDLAQLPRGKSVFKSRAAVRLEQSVHV